MTLQTGSCGGVTEGKHAGYGPITAWQGYRANHSVAGLQGQSQRGRVTGQSQRGRVTGPITAWQGYRANHSVAGPRTGSLIMALQGQGRVGLDVLASASPHEKRGRGLKQPMPEAPSSSDILGDGTSEVGC